MNWDSLDDKQKKANILGVLSNLVRVDEVVTVEERQYLNALGQQFGFSPGELDLILSSKTGFALPTSEVDRTSIMFYLLLLMKVDKHISKREEHIIYHYGFKLGFRDTLVQNLVNVIKTYTHQKLPPNILLEKVKAYLN